MIYRRTHCRAQGLLLYEEGRARLGLYSFKRSWSFIPDTNQAESNLNDGHAHEPYIYLCAHI